MSTSKTYQQSLANASSETRSPMLERGSYIPWAIRFRRYINQKRENRKWLNKALDEGPYQFQMFVHSDLTVPKLQTAEDLQGDALLHYDAKMELMNLILLSIPNEIYNSVDACTTDKKIWKRVERLMRGTIQNQVDRETCFTNEFDQIVAEPGEALVSVYNRFAQLMNDLERNKMIFLIVTVNTKFLNNLQPEWLKYVTQVCLAKHLTVDSFDDLFDYLQQFEKLVNASRAKKLEKSHDPLALVAHTSSSSINTSSYYVTHPTSVVDYDDDYELDDIQTNSEDPLDSAMLNSGNTGRNTRRAYVQEEVVEGSNAQNETGNVQRTLRTSSLGNTSTVQCYNCSGKGHYARNYQKPRVQDSKYFMEQMLLAKPDEAGVILTDEQNDFLFADASRMEEIEELSANICLMARIQPTNNTSDAGPSYDSAFINEVQSSSINENKEQIQNEDRYLDNILDLEAKLKNNVDLMLKLGNSLQGMFMLGPKPLSVYDPQLKHGLGYSNPYSLKQANSKCPKLYLASSLSNSEIPLNVRDTEDTLDDTSKSQQKMKEKMNDPIAVANKQNCWTIDYQTINALYEDIVPEKEIFAEQKYFPSSFIPSDKTCFQTLSELIQCRSLSKKEIDELIAYVSEKTYAYGAIRAENQNLLSTISELKTRLETVKKGINAASSVRRPMNRDSHVKNSVLANSKNSSKKLAVYVRKNKQTDNTSANVISNKENVNDVNVANATKEKTLLCVSFMQNVLIPCHDKCLAKYKLNVHSNVHRALSTNSRTPKSSDTTYVVLKTRFSEKLTQSKSLDTTSVVSKPKTSVGSASKAKNKISDLTWLMVFQSSNMERITFVLLVKEGKSKKAFSFHPVWFIELCYDHSKLELLHMDLCGPMRVASINRKKYILVIVDDYSRYTCICFLHSIDETPEIIKKFIAQAQLNYKARVCKIRNDNGTEFKNGLLKAHYEKLGIMQQISTARTPQ
ncbi:integrase, catalytic region, zinc finger, CCHC-type containing protein [Tanacetum coccineum]